MKLQIESWLEDQDLPQKSEELITEGIVCYKVGAYKASLLLSYLSFLHTLKARLEKARDSKPETVPEKTWNTFIKQIEDESYWDEAVFKTTQMKVPDSNISAIYLVNSDLRKEVDYWRGKRNECAHAKDSIIHSSHVETFWWFLQAHLSKFTVNGGKNSLLEKISQHYDSRYTPPKKDPRYLINEIPLVVNSSEIPELLKDIYLFFENKYILEFEIDDKEGDFYSFWKFLLFSTDKKLRDSFNQFVNSDLTTFSLFVITFPELIPQFVNSPLIRRYWTEEVKKHTFYNNFWKSVTLLLEHVIPQNETNSFVKKISTLSFWIRPSAAEVNILKKYGYFNELKTKLFQSGDLNKPFHGFKFANKHCDDLIFYLQNVNPDPIVVKEINKLLEVMEYGSFLDAFIELWNSDDNFRESYEEIIFEEDLDLAMILK